MTIHPFLTYRFRAARLEYWVVNIVVSKGMSFNRESCNSDPIPFWRTDG